MADLPKRSRTHELEAKSRLAFAQGLSTLFHIQSPDGSDYGTDVIVEATESGHSTNLRVHVQLKATDAHPAKDGKFFVRVKPANLNYLLAQPESIYVLFSSITGKLYYRRAEEVAKERESSGKRTKTVLIKFAVPFDADAQELLHQRVLWTGRLARSLRLNWAGLPPARLVAALEAFHQESAVPVPPTLREAAAQLKSLRDTRRESQLVASAQGYLDRYGSEPVICHLVYMGVVDAASAGHLVPKELLEEAAAFWERGLDSTSGNDIGVTCYNIANAHQALGNYDGAVELYLKCLEQFPKWAAARKNLAGAYTSLGRLAEAKRELEAALEICPLLFEVRHSLAMIAFSTDDFAGCLQHFDQIVQTDLNCMQRAAVQAWKAKALASSRSLGQAIGAAELALEQAPDEEWAWSAAAQVYGLATRDDRRHADRAAAFWARYARRQPADVRIKAELGFALWTLLTTHGRPADTARLRRSCLEAFVAAEEFDSEENGLISDRIGHLYAELGEKQKAVDAYRSAATKNSAEFGYCLGCALMDVGQHHEALVYLDDAARLHQRDALAWKQLGICYDRLGRPADSISAFEQAWRIDPSDASIAFSVGGALWNSGQIKHAIGVWREALLKHPDHPDAATATACLDSLDRAAERMRSGDGGEQ